MNAITSRRPISRTAILLAILLNSACSRKATSSNDPAGFVVRLGTDTIMVERFATSGRRTEGDIVERSPSTTLMHYAFDVDTNANITLGLVHDSSADVGRVRMSVSRQPEIVERLTITVDGRPGGGGRLRFAWDTVVAELPFQVVR